jgi:DNA-binding CsgD family transcriptional regulator
VNDLSIREAQILRLVAAGMTTKAIAATLSIAESTVNWHVGNVLAKLGAASRAEAVAIVLRDGEPAPPPVVIVRPPASRRGRWWLAAAAAIGFLLALAGGTSVAAWYFGTHRAAPAPSDAPPQPPVATETASALPSSGGASGSPGPNSGVEAPSDPSMTGPLASAPPLPVPTPRLAAPTVVPTVTLPPLPTPPPLPTVPIPSIPPVPPVPPVLGRLLP